MLSQAVVSKNTVDKGTSGQYRSPCESVDKKNTLTLLAFPLYSRIDACSPPPSHDLQWEED